MGGLFEGHNRPQVESPVLSTRAANEDFTPHLTAVLASPGNVIFNQLICSYLVNAREVITLTEPFCLPQVDDLA